ncbi:MAG TPA: hypothetical protein EYH45_07490 [Candidatus Caldiarchaeum subterraneum]|uniref:Uncharacterized protein n=1 Tax=Caldiarchaeum subterraneum TaxID=311458 RepID=A0A832ZWY4_CALS0|nr:hypothetical protein [Candidatus Caldarchaeum subterraneum]
MSGEEDNDVIDLIVVGFEGDDCLVSPTAPLSPEEMQKLVGKDVEYEDFKGVVWKGTALELVDNEILRVRFEEAALSEGGPSGLGQGSLVRIKKPK